MYLNDAQSAEKLSSKLVKYERNTINTLEPSELLIDSILNLIKSLMLYDFPLILTNELFFS